MRQFSYPFEPGGPEHLVIETTSDYRGAQILLDEVPVGAFIHRTDFKRGGEFGIKGGGRLAVKLEYGFFGIHLLLHYNGMPLHVLARDFPMRLRTASTGLFLFGGLWLLTGITVLTATSGGPDLRGADPLAWLMRWVPLMGGAGLIVLAAFIRQGSISATVVAVVFFSLYLLLILGSALLFAPTPVVALGAIIPVLIVLALVYALRGIRELNRDRAMWSRLQAPTKVAMPQAKPPPAAEPESSESA